MPETIRSRSAMIYPRNLKMSTDIVGNVNKRLAAHYGIPVLRRDFTPRRAEVLIRAWSAFVSAAISASRLAIFRSVTSGSRVLRLPGGGDRVRQEL